MRNRIIAIGLVSFILLASIIGMRWYAGKQKTQSAGPAAPLVITALAQADKKAAKLSLTGTIEAFRETMVGSKTAGRVQQILVEDGFAVDAGQSLVILESREAENSVRMSQASVTQSLANLTDSRADYQRYQTLYEKGAVSEQQLSAAQTKMQVDEAQYQLQLSSLANAREELGNTVVVAPVAGYVANKSVVLGTVVSSGTTLMQVHDITSVYLTVWVQQKDIARLSVGQAADITADAYPGRIFPGSVEIINPAAGQNSRTFKVKIKIPNADLALKPGMFAKGEIALGAPRDVVTIPQSALWVKDGKSFAFTVDGTKVSQTPVNVEEIFDKTAAVSGISAGTKVVTDGLHSIKDGDNVRLAN